MLVCSCRKIKAICRWPGLSLNSRQTYFKCSGIFPLHLRGGNVLQGKLPLTCTSAGGIPHCENDVGGGGGGREQYSSIFVNFAALKNSNSPKYSCSRLSGARLSVYQIDLRWGYVQNRRRPPALRLQNRSFIARPCGCSRSSPGLLFSQLA